MSEIVSKRSQIREQQGIRRGRFLLLIAQPEFSETTPKTARSRILADNGDKTKRAAP